MMRVISVAVGFGIPFLQIGGSAPSSSSVENVAGLVNEIRENHGSLEKYHRLRPIDTSVSYVVQGEDVLNFFGGKDKENKRSLTDIFGFWITDRKDELRQEVAANGGRFVVIKDFLQHGFHEKIKQSYPNPLSLSGKSSPWFKYENPLEVKYLLDDIKIMPTPVKDLIHALSHPTVAKTFEEMFNFETELHYDPRIHGAGLHSMSRYGRLNLHLDYEKHPYFEKKQRRLNVIFFVLKGEWRREWKGATQLWTGGKVVTRSQKNSNGVEATDISQARLIHEQFPERNVAVVFRTDEDSFHGVPEVLKCPENVTRDTVPFYYLSDLSSSQDTSKIGAQEDGYRKKATYMNLADIVKSSGGDTGSSIASSSSSSSSKGSVKGTKGTDDPPNSDTDSDLSLENLDPRSEKYKTRMRRLVETKRKMEALYAIRATRRIKKEDMDQIWPDWTPDIDVLDGTPGKEEL